MADDAVKELVAKLTLNIGDWDASVKEAREALSVINDEDKTAQAVSKAASAAAIQSIKEQVAAQELLKAQSVAQAEAERTKAEAAKATAEQTKAAASASVTASQVTLAAEKAKAAAIETAAAASKLANDQALASTRAQVAEETAAHLKKLDAMREEQGALAKEIAERNLNIKKIQEEAAAERAKFLEQQHSAHEGKKEPGGISGLVGGTLQTLAGGKGSLGGGLVAGLIGGAAGAAIFETLSEGLTKLSEKIKEFVEDSGGLQKVLETFTKLNELKYGDSGTEFLDQLKEKTHNLVAETDLLRNANTFMGSSLKVSKQQMLDLTEATVGLARGQGHDATQAVQGLTRMFLTGGRGAMQMARIIGVQLPRSAAAGLGPLATQTQKAQVQFDALSKAILHTFASLGAPTLTFTDRLTQMRVVSNELFEAVAQGAVKSTGFTLLIQSMGEFIDKMGGAEEVATKLGEGIGNAFAPVSILFKTITPVFTLIKTLLVDTSRVVTDLVSDFGLLASSSNPIEQNFAKLHPIINLMAKSFALFAGLIADAVNGLDLLVQIGQKLPRTFGDPRAAQTADQSKTYTELLQQYQDRSDNIKNNVYGAADHIGEDYEKASHKQKVPPGKPLGPPPDPAAARRERLAEERASQAAQKKLAEENYSFVKEKIAEEEEANEELYKAGSKSAEDYYETKKRLAKDSYDATIQHIDDETEATLQANRSKLKENEISPKTFTIEYITAMRQQETQKNNAQATLNKATSGANIGETAELNREQIALINAQLDARKSELAQETDAVKSNYAEQLTSSKEYFTQSMDLLKDNAQAVIDAESQKQQIGLKPEQQEASLKTQQHAYEELYKSLEDMEEHYTEQVLANSQKRFGNINSTISTTASILQNEGGAGASPSAQSGFLQQQRDAADAQITSLETLLSTTKEYSQTWFQIYDAILATTQQAQNLSEQMQQLSSYSGQAGNVLTAFAKNTSGVFTSKYGRGFESAIGGAGESLQTSRQQVQQIFGKHTAEVDKLQPYIDATKEATQGMIESAKNSSSGLDSFATQLATAKDAVVSALNQLAQALQAVVGPKSTGAGVNELQTLSPSSITATTSALPVLISPSQYNPTTSPVGGPVTSNAIPPENAGTTSTSEDEDDSEGSTPSIASAGTGLKDFTTKLTGAIGAIGGFISSITSAGSASAGAFGGGVSGAGLGQAVGSSLGSSGGPLSSLGSFAGPFGALIGASLGAALGGIMGQKQEEVTDDINALNVSYKAIMSDYSSNNASLQATIQNIQGLIAQVEQDQANSKKGGSQFAQMITQYNEQIQQLQAQAAQTMSQLQQQLDVITSPVPFQSLLTSVQSIIQQYTQFAGAAQNATDLANANQYLVSSLQNLGQSYTDTLRTDEESAIADALSLNQLYTQRNQLQLQFLQSTEQIMGQGTLTRQITSSQSKFSQLYTLDVNHQNQLDELNQEIDVTQYKVTAEQQIFNLATTKAGLEQQTLVLQEQGINLDMARISAMQSLLATLQSTGFSITNLNSVSATDPNTLMQLLLSLLLGQLQGSGALSGYTAPNGQSSLLDSLVSSTYSSRQQMGYAAFRGSNL